METPIQVLALQVRGQVWPNPRGGFLAILKITSDSFCLWKMTDSKTTILSVLAGRMGLMQALALGSAGLTLKCLLSLL